jgi:hypothetical protein
MDFPSKNIFLHKVGQNFFLQISGNVWQNPLILEIGVNKMQKFATEKKKNTDCKH